MDTDGSTCRYPTRLPGPIRLCEDLRIRHGQVVTPGAEKIPRGVPQLVSVNPSDGQSTAHHPTGPGVLRSAADRYDGCHDPKGRTAVHYTVH
jgi:hypothetical protein